MKKIIFFTLAVFLLTGCATDGKFYASHLKDKNSKIYTVDLDNDGVRETIKIEDLGSSWAVFVMRSDNKETASLKAAGRIIRAEFIDLKRDGFRQIAIFYYDGQDMSNLAIYSFKDEKLSEAFFVSSKCAIEADFSGLPRIKVGKPGPGRSQCLGDNTDEWVSWVWTGDKFIKEI